MKKTPDQIDSQQPVNEAKKPRRVFVDLGSGAVPSAFWGNREFKGDDFYVGVDNRRTMIRSALSTRNIARNKPNFDRVGQNILFVDGDVNRTLPFADASVVEVLLGNVFGEFAIKTMDGFLAEANRILQSNGILVVFETQTPNVTRDWRDERGVDYIVKQFGFEKIKEINSGDPEFEKEVLKYNAFHIPHENSFIMYFRKNVTIV